MEGNGDRTIKILIGVIIGLSAIILFSGIFYILNMQSKIAKLETEQKEQEKRQLETQNMASIQTIQPQQNEKQQPQSSQTNTTNKSESKTKTKKINLATSKVNFIKDSQGWKVVEESK